MQPSADNSPADFAEVADNTCPALRIQRNLRATPQKNVKAKK